MIGVGVDAVEIDRSGPLPSRRPRRGGVPPVAHVAGRAPAWALHRWVLRGDVSHNDTAAVAAAVAVSAP